MQQIKELFPDSEPFYAGFGDAKTDIETYTAVGFPHERIFHVKVILVLCSRVLDCKCLMSGLAGTRLEWDSLLDVCFERAGRF